MQEHIWIDWLNRRGVSNAIIEQFSLRWDKHSVLGECIVIPVLDEKGELSFNKYRRDPLQGDVKPKYVYDKGGRSTLYGADKVVDEAAVLITEGELDALVAWSLKIPAVSSTGGAGTFMPEWVDLLKGKEVTICFDNDEAGGRGMAKVFSLLPEAKILFLPERAGVKDITDYVAGGGNFHELARNAKSFSNLQDVIDDRSRRLSLWQSVHFHDAYIEMNTVPEFVKPERTVRSDAGDVERAKAHPIPNLLKFDRNSKAPCIWHEEKTPSLHYFKKTNTVYCFGGCGKRGDAIDVYRQINHCSFLEAVKALI